MYSNVNPHAKRGNCSKAEHVNPKTHLYIHFDAPIVSSKGGARKELPLRVSVHFNPIYLLSVPDSNLFNLIWAYFV